ncbi:MAG: endonuclease/exonuclease/phosphatase family protein [Spirochaetes bacterium]|nr:endonuclease/exonuclease/phosphatase family protein [Spirochaetota bacterium]
MKNRKKRGLFAGLFFAFIALSLFACSLSRAQNEDSGQHGPSGRSGQSGQSLVLMTWNLHNLFDASDTGSRYDQFRGSAGWSAEKYLGRLNVMAAAISQIHPPPDLIAVQEVGSKEALQDLAALLPGYHWTHFAANPGAPVGLGVISRYPLEKTAAHSVYLNGITAPRPVQEVHIDAGGQRLVIFNNHWKSKVGGADATEAQRMASARVSLRRLRELAAAEENPLVIILGDLNVNHDDFFRRGAAVYALLSDHPEAAKAAGGLQMDFLVTSGEKPPLPRYFPEDTFVFFSPWYHAGGGSYFFRNSWQTIDHFLLSAGFFGGSPWVYADFIVIDSPPFANSRGSPAAFNPRTGIGMSDHFPLLLVLRKR